jgi:hypothetical protein
MLTGTPIETADVNSDGVVAPIDALIVLNHIGTSNAHYDLDNDGTVAEPDFQLVLDALAADAALAGPCHDPSTPSSADSTSATEQLGGCGCQDDEVPD